MFVFANLTLYFLSFMLCFADVMLMVNPRRKVRRFLSANRSGSDWLLCYRKILELSRSLPLWFAADNFFRLGCIFVNFTLYFASPTLLFANFMLYFANLTLLFANRMLYFANLTLLFANFMLYFVNLTLLFVNRMLHFANRMLHFAAKSGVAPFSMGASSGRKRT